MGSNKDSLGDRMKDYEVRSRSYVPRRTSAVLRIDGKAFHTYTRGLSKPFDKLLFDAMAEATKYLCENVQGAKIGYMQSDEISVLLTDYDDIKTDAWFDYQVEKMVSVAASLATTKFLHERVKQIIAEPSTTVTVKMNDIFKMKLPSFDARVLALPNDEEVVNYFIWRQQDAERNSIQALAQAHFSHSQLHKKDTADMQDMLHAKGINWNDCPTVQKRGVSVVKKVIDKPSVTPKGETVIVPRSAWVIDDEMPILTKDKGYVRSLLPKRC